MQKLSHDPRAMKALTGLSYQEFTDLLGTFEKAYLDEQRRKPNRQRKVGGGKKGKLPTMESKLFFILFYLKAYPTFDVLGFMTDRDRGKCCRSVHLLLKALKKALGREIVLPERKIRTVEEFLEKFPEAKDVFFDGTERRIERPKNKKRQTKLYSGKKKANTRKNVIVSDEKKRVLFLSPSKSGRRHDKRIVDKSILKIPDNVGKWADTGFKGLDKIYENTVMPKKGTKKHPLSQEDKANNKIISSFRVVIEHAIAGIKRFRVLTDTLRNKLGLFDDMIIEVCSGLWNFHLRYAR
jgi:DDE superfamily endonuclease/Helix-turn-helix of DDE superfamily endonuclease